MKCIEPAFEFWDTHICLPWVGTKYATSPLNSLFNILKMLLCKAQYHFSLFNAFYFWKSRNWTSWKFHSNLSKSSVTYYMDRDKTYFSIDAFAIFYFQIFVSQLFCYWLGTVPVSLLSVTLYSCKRANWAIWLVLMVRFLR